MISFLQKVIFIILFSVVFISCNSKLDFETRISEIKKIEKSIDSCIGWFKEKDFDLLFSVVAHDSNFLSVHPTNKMVRGYDEFLMNSEI